MTNFDRLTTLERARYRLTAGSCHSVKTQLEMLPEGVDSDLMVMVEELEKALTDRINAVSKMDLDAEAPEKEDEDMYRYICVMRPPMLGGIPRDFENIEFFDATVEDAGGHTHHAYGAVEYARPLTDEEIYQYELLEADGCEVYPMKEVM